MRTISATEASRRFSDLLDAIEAGESVTVTRGNRPIAEIRPASLRRGRDLRSALEGIPAPDEQFAADIAQTLGHLITEPGRDPWADA
jgi:prevent-host-death family protein